jgi:hypothetical protein
MRDYSALTVGNMLRMRTLPAGFIARSFDLGRP